MTDFTAWPHPVLAVPCPSCGRRAGVMCRRPSGHKAADFHARRKAEARHGSCFSSRTSSVKLSATKRMRAVIAPASRPSGQ